MIIKTLIKTQSLSAVNLKALNSMPSSIPKRAYTAPKLTLLMPNDFAGGDQVHVAESEGGFLTAS